MGIFVELDNDLHYIIGKEHDLLTRYNNLQTVENKSD